MSSLKFILLQNTVWTIYVVKMKRKVRTKKH